MTKQFYIDWCNYIKEVFKKIDIKKVSSNFDDYKLMKLINIYVAGIYFGSGYEESKRKEIYGHGNWKVIGDTINIESIKNKGVARCIEKAAAFNGIANFMGIESSLILSEASLNDGEKIGHAYCMLRLNNEYLICDPNFYGTNDLGMGIPFLFSLNNQDTNKVVFNSNKFADKNPKIVEYYFPWHDFNDIKGKSRS